ncbi:MAG: hypothetical protein U9N46_06875 [Euryarchaeota archaeon]|nr:hypothetical protein [Euryarchaeota archaeon]
MVSWMYNNAKDVKTEIDNTLRVSAPLRPCVKLENNNAKMQRRDGAKNKSLRVYFTGIFGCAASGFQQSFIPQKRPISHHAQSNRRDTGVDMA